MYLHLFEFTHIDLHLLHYIHIDLNLFESMHIYLNLNEFIFNIKITITEKQLTPNNNKSQLGHITTEL
jgi:hypothetical protein